MQICLTHAIRIDVRNRFMASCAEVFTKCARMRYNGSMAMKVILGSGSPRRRELLARITPYELRTADTDERCSLENPAQRVMYTAGIKSMALAVNDAEVLITADTLVYCNGAFLGKPKDRADAVRMLVEMNHGINEVYTGVCLRTSQSMDFFVVRSAVRMDMTADEIQAYVDGGSPLDKAGAYGIQDPDYKGHIVEGSMDNVMGLPIEELRDALLRHGYID